MIGELESSQKCRFVPSKRVCLGPLYWHGVLWKPSFVIGKAKCSNPYLCEDLSSMRLCIRQIVHVKCVFSANVATSDAISTSSAFGLRHSYVISQLVLKSNEQWYLDEDLIQVFDVKTTEGLLHSVNFMQVRIVIRICCWFNHVEEMLSVNAHQLSYVILQLLWPSGVFEYRRIHV